MELEVKMPVNEINEYIYNTSSWIENIDQFEKVVNNLNKISEIIKSSKDKLDMSLNYSASWNAEEAKKAHDDFKNFCDKYAVDLQSPINEYKDAAKVLSEEVAELKAESNVIRKIKEIR
jgi:hypothetical protein